MSYYNEILKNQTRDLARRRAKLGASMKALGIEPHDGDPPAPASDNVVALFRRLGFLDPDEAAVGLKHPRVGRRVVVENLEAALGNLHGYRDRIISAARAMETAEVVALALFISAKNRRAMAPKDKPTWAAAMSAAMAEFPGLEGAYRTDKARIYSRLVELRGTD